MSLVYITYHEENIHDIEKKNYADEHIHFPKYVSIHRKKSKNAPPNQSVQKDTKFISISNTYLHKTMGQSEVVLDNPSQYLKKNGGIKWQRVNEHVCEPSRNISPIPKHKETTKKESRQKINFIKKNIKRIKTLAPPSLSDKFIDTVVGERHNINGSVLVPVHIFSKHYGSTPVYLNGIKKSLETTSCYNHLQQAKTKTSQGVPALSNSDREIILLGLRKNLSELEKTYQLQPIFTDTNSKKQRKAKLEYDLKRLEQDVLLMQSYPEILICEE